MDEKDYEKLSLEEQKEEVIKMVDQLDEEGLNIVLEYLEKEGYKD